MGRSRNIYFYIPVDAAQHNVFHQNGRNVFYDVFIQGQSLCDASLYILIRFVMINDLIDLPQSFSAYRQGILQNYLGFQKRQGVAFDRGGVMRIL
ncbi:hypothetical protein D3C75_1059620 [compost metagenome]